MSILEQLEVAALDAQSQSLATPCARRHIVGPPHAYRSDARRRSPPSADSPRGFGAPPEPETSWPPLQGISAEGEQVTERVTGPTRTSPLRTFYRAWLKAIRQRLETKNIAFPDTSLWRCRFRCFRQRHQISERGD